MAIPVKLPVFEGPLDLLLHLIEKNRIDIYDIPIVEITDQYLAYIEQMERMDLGVVSEFMVMAATLIDIKCRMLLPKEIDETGEEKDPREELVQKLLEYKTFKHMSYELRGRMEEAGDVFYKDKTLPPEVEKYQEPVDPEELLGNLTLDRLRRIFESVMRRQEDKRDPIRSRFGRIEKEEVSLPEKMEYIRSYSWNHSSFRFRELLESQCSKVQVIVTFLAVLELIKRGAVRASQKEILGDIEIELLKVPSDWGDLSEEASEVQPE